MHIHDVCVCVSVEKQTLQQGFSPVLEIMAM